MTATWVGMTFKVLSHRDGKMLRTPGLFAFVRSDTRDGPLLLFAGEGEDLAQVAGPGHAKWSEALSLGMDELHVSFPIPRRIDRLQLVARIVAREQPLLNVVDEQSTPAAWWLPARSACSSNATSEVMDERITTTPRVRASKFSQYSVRRERAAREYCDDRAGGPAAHLPQVRPPRRWPRLAEPVNGW